MIATEVGSGRWRPADYQERLEAAAGKAGALASFIGRMRGGNGIEALELSHYAPLTAPGIEAMAREAAATFKLEALVIYHSLGHHRPDDPLVFVGAAARHRRGAINAVDYCMDHLKCAAWLWKRERKDGVWRWVNPRAADHSDLARWKNYVNTGAV
ncbi:MAG: molybdenum cofactor biosynthesis protein MoaE [Erythrobacter sp.]